ncbi:hypothetical protein MC885_021425 [Smutsia gigantea]|nr:hypothetical protein MC885_021425 [Smutsia gigantea]
MPPKEKSGSGKGGKGGAGRASRENAAEGRSLWGFRVPQAVQYSTGQTPPVQKHGKITEAKNKEKLKSGMRFSEVATQYSNDKARQGRDLG